MDEIRLLGKEDIDVRVAQTTSYNNNGQLVVKVNLLLYKDARVDMKILDELFTPFGWKRTHKMIGDRLYCQVEVWDEEKGEWICKEDVGVESNTEAEKGQASDSFKRACVNWGIGRELYTAPKVCVELTEREYTRDQNGKIRVWAAFSVKSIAYDTKTRTITGLEIVDRFGNVRYTLGATEAEKPARPKRTGAKPKEQASDYKPVEEGIYWKIVEAHAQGIPTKSGGSCREAWIKMTNAGNEQIAKFDMDVDNYKIANNL